MSFDNKQLHDCFMINFRRLRKIKREGEKRIWRRKRKQIRKNGMKLPVERKYLPRLPYLTPYLRDQISLRHPFLNDLFKFDSQNWFTFGSTAFQNKKIYYSSTNTSELDTKRRRDINMINMPIYRLINSCS
jgi:hypothetical protein